MIFYLLFFSSSSSFSLAVQQQQRKWWGWWGRKWMCQFSHFTQLCEYRLKRGAGSNFPLTFGWVFLDQAMLGNICLGLVTHCLQCNITFLFATLTVLHLPYASSLFVFSPNPYPYLCLIRNIGIIFHTCFSASSPQLVLFLSYQLFIILHKFFSSSM